MEEKLKIGTRYKYEVGNEEESYFVFGDVIYNDGVTTILRVTSMYLECEYLTLNYDEVRKYFQDFTDPEHTDRTCYLCLDVAGERISYYHDIDSYQIITPDTDLDDLFPDYEDDSDEESVPDEGSNIV